MFLLLFCIFDVNGKITIYKDSLIREIQPSVFGSGDEITEDFRGAEVKDLIKETSPSFLRFGGNAAEYYDWEGNDYNGIFYVDIGNSMLADSLFFGTDSFLRMCEEFDIEPIIVVNFQINDLSKAARWVEYCNGDTNTEMGKIRKQRGHPQPYNVVYWSIGNEPDISGSKMSVITYYRHFGKPFNEWSINDSSFVSKEAFATLFKNYADSMRARSPIPIKLFFCLASDLSWIKPVLELNRDNIDYLDIHYYPNFYDGPTSSSVYRQWLFSIENGSEFKPPFKEWIEEVRDSIRMYEGDNDIALTILEYNGGFMATPDKLWWNYYTGLFIGDMIGRLIEEDIPIGCIYSIYEGDPEEDNLPLFGIIRGDTLSKRMPSYVLQLYRENFGKYFIKTTSDRKTGGLITYGSLKENGNINLMVINKNLDTAFVMEISYPGFQSQGIVRIKEIKNDTTIQAPFNGTKGIIDYGEIPVDSQRFTNRFEPGTITSIEIYTYQGIKEEILKNPPFTSVYKNGKVYLNFKESDTYHISIYALSGAKICEKTIKGKTGIIPLDSKGIYFIRLKSYKGQAFRKIVVY